MSEGMSKERLRKEICAAVELSTDKVGLLNWLKELLHEISPQHAMPVDLVRWVPLDAVVANDYNPNSVARNEMRLLLHSIDEDGYTQPVVTVFDESRGKYVVVDGFHRYTVCRENEEIRSRTGGRLPVVVIQKPLGDRMASTVRHNRARGKHSIAGMANLVFQMLDEGKDDAEILKNLGMEPDELLRLKHITGFSKLFENVEYRRAWETSKQLAIRQQWQKEHPNEPSDIASIGR